MASWVSRSSLRQHFYGLSFPENGILGSIVKLECTLTTHPANGISRGIVTPPPEDNVRFDVEKQNV
jgi:hypothetical protein